MGRVGDALVAIWLLLVVGLGSFVFYVSPVEAASTLGPDAHCTVGDAKAVEEAFYPRLWRGNPNEEPFASADRNNLCSFRTFWEPEEGICFCEEDTFTGGVVYSDYSSDLAELKALKGALHEMVVEFDVEAPPGAEWTEFDTGVKGFGVDYVDGVKVHVILRQFGLTFTSAVPGAYEIRSTQSHPLYGQEEFLVTFTVLPHETAHDLGRPDGPLKGLTGSVTCPD